MRGRTAYTSSPVFKRARGIANICQHPLKLLCSLQTCKPRQWLMAETWRGSTVDNIAYRLGSRYSWDTKCCRQTHLATAQAVAL